MIKSAKWKRYDHEKINRISGFIQASINIQFPFNLTVFLRRTLIFNSKAFDFIKRLIPLQFITGKKKNAKEKN